MTSEVVDGFGYAKISSGTLSSGGLGPAIAVGAIHNGNGYMAVFLDERFCAPLDIFLQGMKHLRNNGSVPDIYVAGGALLARRRMNEYTMEAREYVSRRLEEEGFEDARVSWAKDDTAQEMILNVEERSVVYTETPIQPGTDNPIALKQDSSHIWKWQ